jgi:Xaa-Pro aminopeptidase
MKETAILTDLGMQAGFDSIEVGKRGNEVAADIMNAMLKGTPEIGGFATSNIMMPTGEEFAATYHTS